MKLQHKFLRIFILWVLATTHSQQIKAQMTLDDCLKYARDHAFQNAKNRIAVESAKADTRAALSSFLPSVSVSSSGNLSFGRNIDPETNTYDNKKTLATGFGLYMSLPLFNGLVNINTFKATRIARLRRRQDSEIEQDRISLDVIKGFYNVVYCKAMVEQVSHQLRRDSLDLAATDKGYALGIKSGADVAEMKALVATDEFELSTQRNLLAKAYLELRSLIGMEFSDDPLQIDEESQYRPVATGATHPKILEAQLAVKEQEYNLRSARGKLLPSISVNAGISTSYYKMIGSPSPVPAFSRQWHDNMGQYVGFSISFPLFSGFSRVAAIRKATLSLEENRIALEQTNYEIQRATAEARLDLAAAGEEIRSATKRLEAEQAAYNAIRRKFELGNASVIDLYTSGARLATARAGYEGARIRQITGQIILDYYLGAKLINE